MSIFPRRNVSTVQFVGGSQPAARWEKHANCTQREATPDMIDWAQQRRVYICPYKHRWAHTQLLGLHAGLPLGPSASSPTPAGSCDWPKLLWSCLWRRGPSRGSRELCIHLTGHLWMETFTTGCLCLQNLITWGGGAVSSSYLKSWSPPGPVACTPDSSPCCPKTSRRSSALRRRIRAASVSTCRSSARPPAPQRRRRGNRGWGVPGRWRTPPRRGFCPASSSGADGRWAQGSLRRAKFEQSVWQRSDQAAERAARALFPRWFAFILLELKGKKPHDLCQF